MGIAEQWEKTPRKRKISIFAFLGVAALVALFAGMALGTGVITGEDQAAPVAETNLDNCTSFRIAPQNQNNDLTTEFYHQGLACSGCAELDGVVSLTGCDNLCPNWQVNGVSILPVEDDCDEFFFPTPEPVPGADFECPEGTYSTVSDTGCVADSFDDFKILLSLCIHLDVGNVTIDTCIDTCEEIEDCGGISVSEDGLHCFVFREAANEICNFPRENETVCKPINEEIDCFAGNFSFDSGRQFCEDRGQVLAIRVEPDEGNVQLNRLDRDCPAGTLCYFDGGDDRCRFIGDGIFGESPDCDIERGVCCETTTNAPTTSPTQSPTEELFFVPDNCFGADDFTQLSFDDAVQCCEDNDADLAAIKSQAEQDFAFEVCLDVIEDISNECGCWIGLERDREVASTDKEDFFFTDGSGNIGDEGNEFDNFETEPNVQPNNLDNRNEACVHMRPFTDGGWNDLPCLGNCDAEDTRPLPLCRLRTPAPTTSPTRNPTTNPTRSPTFNPTRLPTQNPTTSPTRNPTRNPTTSPTRNPTQNPTENPTKNPTTSPTRNPTENPTQNPTENPTENPTRNPTKNPTQNPTRNPTKNPTQNPTQNPTENPTRNPTQNPTENPTRNPTRNPTQNPTRNPTKNPTQNPTQNPTENPTKNPTTSPTRNPTQNPTENPTENPTKNPTHNPTTSPTRNPTRNPTENPTRNPTTSPTRNPTQNPTERPTRNPTISPTQNPTQNPTENPTQNPTTSPTRNPTKNPTQNPTENPTENPTKNPTRNPTQNPTQNPTTNPTQNPTQNPTTNPTENPTENPTRNPTQNPTKNPTTNPTRNPTKNPTQNPTENPTRNPTQNPTQNPTTNPTQNPTTSPTRNPTKNPTTSPTKNPTNNPTTNPTQNPTTSPTRNPTENPTTSPTTNPTTSPTLSPIVNTLTPIPVCTFGGEEYIWRLFNANRDAVIPFRYQFNNPNGRRFLEGDQPFYGGCFFDVCFSNAFNLRPSDTFEFRSPTDRIVVEFPCETADPTFICEVEFIAPANTLECECENIEFFSDDFESYPVVNGINEDTEGGEEFNAIYTQVGEGQVDVKGFIRDEDGNFIETTSTPEGFEVSSDFFFNPCIDNQCIDLDGTIEFDFLDEGGLSIREIEIEPSNAFFNRICTLNFQVRGNARCGDLHQDLLNIRNSNQARNAGCLQFYAEPVQLSDNLTVTLTENGEVIEETFFEDIPFDQEYLPFGITGDVANGATEVGGSFSIFGGLRLETGLNIGPLLDNVDLTCCCPEENARYVGRIIETSQGTDFEGASIGPLKSDFSGLIGHAPSYFNPYVYSLGLQGSITIEFTLGATGKVIIYEDSYVCCDNFDPEDAIVQGSVDGVFFFDLATTLKGKYKTLPGGAGHIRYTEVDIPNGACIKFIRIIDNSDADAFNCDGYDLIAVEVVEPCCPTNIEPIATQAPTTTQFVPGETSTENFVFAGAASTGSIAAYSVAAIFIIAIAALAFLSVVQGRKNLNEKKVSLGDGAVSTYSQEDMKAELEGGSAEKLI